MLKAVRHHTDRPWVLLYIERWLKAPVQMEDGSVVPRWQERLKEVSSVRSWRICFCIMRSTCGWREPIRTSHSSATRMTSSVTARAPTRRGHYGAHLPTALRPASWCCIPRRRRSSTARMRTGAATFRHHRLTSSASSSGPGRRCGEGQAHPRARLHTRRQPEALTHISRKIRRWALHHRSDKSLQDLAADVQSVHSRLDQLLQPLLPDAVASDPEEDRRLCHPLGTPQVQAACATRPRGQEIGSTGFAAPTQRSSLIGSCVMATAEHREPCESRGSCTVLGAPGGETPLGDSTNPEPRSRSSLTSASPPRADGVWNPL